MADIQRKIVADSSADLLVLDDFPFASAPLKILTNEHYYVDDAKLDVEAFTEAMLQYDGKSSTACPSPEDWLHAFGDAEEVYCVTISCNLSGSYNAACVAKQTYEEDHPGRRVLVFDSLSTGPEMRLLVDKIRVCIDEGKTMDEIRAELDTYTDQMHILFMLESMKNLANNGRVSHLAAKAAGILGIRAIGMGSEIGTLQMLDKHRGEKKGLAALARHMVDMGLRKGRVLIGHVGNVAAAEKLKALLLESCDCASIEIYRCRGLCSFYAEKGGLIVAFEAF